MVRSVRPSGVRLFKAYCPFVLLMGATSTLVFFFFLNAPPPTEFSPLPLPDPLPISNAPEGCRPPAPPPPSTQDRRATSPRPIAGRRRAVPGDSHARWL